MGHVHVGKLPTTAKWGKVIEMLEEGALPQDVAVATADAAAPGWRAAQGDPALADAIRLLLRFSAPKATTQSVLNDLDPTHDISTPTVFATTGVVADYFFKQRARYPKQLSDISEIAVHSTVVVLLRAARPHEHDPWNGSRSFEGRTLLMKDFVGTVAGRLLNYYISRESAVSAARIPGKARERYDALETEVADYCLAAAQQVEQTIRTWLDGPGKQEASKQEVHKFTKLLITSIQGQLTGNIPTKGTAQGLARRAGAASTARGFQRQGAPVALHRARPNASIAAPTSTNTSAISTGLPPAARPPSAPRRRA